MAIGDLPQDNTTLFRETGSGVQSLFGNQTVFDLGLGPITPITIPTSQSDNAGNGKPYTLTMFIGETKVNEYEFKINPESTNYSFPSRSTVVQTLGGAVIDHFGIGIPVITLTGTTGWNIKGNTDGFKSFQALQQFYEFYQSELNAEETFFIPFVGSLKGTVRIRFDDGPSRLRFFVHLQDLKINRTKARPLLFPYTLTMQVLNADESLENREFVTVDNYADFFANGALRSSLRARAAEIKDNFFGLENNIDLLPESFRTVFQSGIDALDIIDDLSDIGEDSINLIQDTAGFITGNLSRVSRSVRRAARTLQVLTDLPSNIATEFISTVNGIIQAFGDLECVLQDFINGKTLRPRVGLISGGNACSTILGASTPAIRPILGENTFDLLSSAGVPVEILDSVSLSTSAQDSLTLIESVDTAFEDYGSINVLSEIENVINGLVIDTNVDFEQSILEADLNINNVDVISDVESRSIVQGDSLQSIARNRLGEASRWEELAILNNLRYPYISNLFIDTLGPKVADLTILSGAGDTYVFFSLEGATPGQEVYFTDGTDEQAHVILSVNNISKTIVFETATTLTFTALAKVSLHEDTTESNTKVLKVGDFITVPITNLSARSVNSKETEDNQDFNRLFGIDIQLDNNGFLNLDDQAGDLVLTSSGIENIKQAVAIRINTSPEELKHHNDYGIALPERIGPNTSEAQARDIISDLTTGIPTDPRILTVRNVQAVVEGDQIAVKFDSVISNDLSITNFNFAATR